MFRRNQKAKGVKKIEYFQCENCQFWLTSHDRHCPNCQAAIATQNPLLPLKSILFLSGTAGVHAIFQGIHPELGSTPWREVLLLSSLSFGTVFGLSSVVLKTVFAIDLIPRQPNSCLSEDEATIQQRLVEFQTRAQPILTAKERAKKISNTEQRRAIDQTLDQALKILQVHHDRYTTKLWEIQLIRWHNSLKPIINNWHTQREGGSEQLYKNLDAARDSGENLLNSWLQTHLSTTESGSTHIKRLQTALTSCDLLYQNLVARQAAEAVQGISRFEIEPRSSSETQLAQEQLAVLDSLPDVTDFAFGLEDLENEYLRLQSEAELEQQLSTS